MDNLNKLKNKTIKEDEEQYFRKQCENSLLEHYRYKTIKA